MVTTAEWEDVKAALSAQPVLTWDSRDENYHFGGVVEQAQYYWWQAQHADIPFVYKIDFYDAQTEHGEPYAIVYSYHVLNGSRHMDCTKPLGLIGRTPCFNPPQLVVLDALPPEYLRYSQGDVPARVFWDEAVEKEPMLWQ